MSRETFAKWERGDQAVVSVATPLSLPLLLRHIQHPVPRLPGRRAHQKDGEPLHHHSQSCPRVTCQGPSSQEAVEILFTPFPSQSLRNHTNR